MALYIYIYQGRIEGEQFIAVNVLKNIDNQVTYMSIEKFMGCIFLAQRWLWLLRNKQSKDQNYKMFAQFSPLFKLYYKAKKYNNS